MVNKKEYKLVSLWWEYQEYLNTVHEYNTTSYAVFVTEAFEIARYRAHQSNDKFCSHLQAPDWLVNLLADSWSVVRTLSNNDIMLIRGTG